MRKIQVLGALIAVVAFCALTVASASATLWLLNGASLTSEHATDSIGILLLHHKGGLGGSITLECHGTFHGTVGPGALDLVTDVLSLTGVLNLISCTVIERGNCFRSTNEVVNVDAENLPWHTLLELSGSTTIDHFLSETGKEPEWSFTCNIITLNGNCHGLDTTNFSKNGANGAIFEYPGTTKAACSDGGEGTTLGLGETQGAQVS